MSATALLELENVSLAMTTQAAQAILANTQGSGGARILLLSGPLGAGKTTLVQRIAAAYGIQGNVNSPSFNLLNIFSGPQGALYHYDLYRLKSEADLMELDFIERWQRSDEAGAIHAVEWPERAASIWPALPNTFTVLLLPGGSEEERRIVLYSGATALAGADG